MNVMHRVLAISIAVLVSSCATADGRAPTPQESAALALVGKRIAAYNMHDIDAFLATYDSNVRIYVYPERFLGAGTQRMRGIFGPQFARGDGSVRVLSQHVVDGKVVSIEDVTIGGILERNIAIYTIADGHIQEVRLIEPGE
jgi:hypothetical protein